MTMTTPTTTTLHYTRLTFSPLRHTLQYSYATLHCSAPDAAAHYTTQDYAAVHTHYTILLYIPHYIAIHYTILHTTRYHTTLHCTLHCAILHCAILHCTTLHYATLHCTVLHCTTPHHAALHWTTSHYTTQHYKLHLALSTCLLSSYCANITVTGDVGRADVLAVFVQ